MVTAEAADQERASLKPGGMMRRSILKPILAATLVCGSLDILFAMMLTVWRDRAIPDMLRFVASGPFPQATEWGPDGALLGLLVHFTLMAIMVAAFVLAARRIPALTDSPLLWGLLFGLATYVVLNLVVVPLRFPAAWPPKALSVGTQLFAHIILVGWPTAFITRRYLRG
jgi:hypothetical protein